ncbi:MAG: peptidoglycan bridge formation glycyltransferase FemA/FemB family protein [Patescibacteria group bacterium]|jgi:lipid II:glycine glycyltransferase (peptidoglycan interpeptide bridge formation enzyme)
MALEIREIENEKEWQEFEDNFSPHTFLQTWEWGRAQEMMGYKITRLGVYGSERMSGAIAGGKVNEDIEAPSVKPLKEKLRGTALVYKISARRGAFLFCPHGPSVGWKNEEEFRALDGYLKELGKKEKVSFIRVSSLAPASKEMGGLFFKYGYRNAPIHMMHPENAWILDIEGSEESVLAGMKKRTRYSIRKAQKDGVRIATSRDSKDVKLFYGMYLETAQRQKFVPFSENYIMREFEIFEKNNKALMFFAYYQEKIISAAVIIFAGKMAFYHHGASIRMGSSGITASELLQWEAIREARRRGLSGYNFWGIAPPDAPNHPWQGLTLFKKGFGGYPENYLHAQDYKLTNRYWLNYIVEKIRTMKRGY